MRKAWSIGGLSLALSSPTEIPGELPPKHRAFEVDCARADLELDLSLEAVPAPQGPLLFDSEGVWRVFDDGEGARLYHCISPSFSPTLYKGVRVDAGYQRGTLYSPRSAAPLPDGRRLHPLDIPLEQLLASHRLSRDGAAELHACGIVWRGRALLLCGSSGAGKTTSARLWAQRDGAALLSDDRVVVRRLADGWHAFGTPWHGEGGYALPASAPLSAVFFLHQAPADALRRLSPAQATRQLYRVCFPPVWEREVVERQLATLEAVASSVPVHQLDFLPAPSSVELVLAALGAK